LNIWPLKIIDGENFIALSTSKLKTHHIQTCDIKFQLNIFQERESNLHGLLGQASVLEVKANPYRKGLLSCQLSIMDKHQKLDGKDTHLEKLVSCL
jgi:hypothetical protein